MKLLALATVLAFAVPASAATITFDSLASSDYYSTFGPALEIDGYRFVNSNVTGDGFLIWGTGVDFNADPDGATLANNYPSTITTVAAIDGSAFDFFSIDLASVYNDASGGDVLFSFTDALGTTQSIVALAGLSGLESFAFNKTALLSFSYQALSTPGPWIQVDNVVVSPAASVVPGVPEPATWAMLIAGFGLVGAAMRRRAAATA